MLPLCKWPGRGIMWNIPLDPRKYWRVWFQYSIVKNYIMYSIQYFTVYSTLLYTVLTVYSTYCTVYSTVLYVALYCTQCYTNHLQTPWDGRPSTVFPPGHDWGLPPGQGPAPGEGPRWGGGPAGHHSPLTLFWALGQFLREQILNEITPKYVHV